MANTNKKPGVHLTIGVITLVLTVLALCLFLGSFTTNYYTFGGMNSGLILTLILGAIAFTALSWWLNRKFPENVWVRFAPFAVIACLAAAAMLLVGDRVEGIGNCIVTDYDSGHGGEEAIYMSLASSVLMLIAMVYNIIGSFHKDPNAPGRVRNLAYSIVAAVLVVAVGITTVMLTGVLALGGRTVVSDGQGGYTGQRKGSYTVSFNGNAGNVDLVQDYEFIPATTKGLLNADSRLFLDLTLTLDGAGNYSLLADSYCMEAGQRCKIGDDTGLGLILTTKAEGTYVTNENGTVTTSPATHAVAEMATDTYSVQMKGPAKMAVGEHDEDGTYDSAEYPEVLALVPETVWTLDGSAIASYGKPALSGSFTVSFNGNAGNVDLVQDYEFIPATTKGLLNADSRLFLDFTLTLDGAGHYELLADSYCMEAGARCVIGDDTGLGLVLTTKAEGTYVDNGDGTVTTSPATHAVAEMATDTYSVQMKGPAKMAMGEHDEDGTYDSAEYPEVLALVPETVWTLSGGAIEGYFDPNAEEETVEEPAEEAPAAESAEVQSVTIVSDDEGTKMTFNADGTYRFDFEAYSIVDEGTYTYEGGVLTVKDANGVEYKAEGDPMHLHYGYSGAPDQLTGEYTIPAETFHFAAAEAEENAGVQGVTIASDDEGTKMTFNSDGTYRFNFEAYSIVDEGTYTYENGVLTVKDANGVEYTAEGDPMHLHYGYSGAPDQLTGEYTIPAETFAFAPAEESAPAEYTEVQSVTIASDDEGTKMTFNSDGTYRFDFEAYSIVDEGTYTYEGGVLTVKDANGVEYKAEGDPMHLHYGYSGAPDQLTGEYTIPAETFSFASAAAAAEEEDEELLSLTVLSDDRGTSMTFNSDGTYRFWFAAYSIEDLGTWQRADGVLSLTDANGVVYTVEGAPYKLHYAYSASDQLTGDYTIPAGVFPFPASGTSVPSDDLGTGMTFFADGTYLFTFDSYSIADAGTWTYEGGVLTLKDVNGVEYKADGEELHLHYGYSGSPDLLTGEYTIDPAIFSQE